MPLTALLNASSEEDEPSVLEAIMDQVKLDALVEAAFQAQRKLKAAGQEWERANARLKEHPDPCPEGDLNKLVGDMLGDQDKVVLEIRGEIQAWATQKAAHASAKKENREAGERLKKCVDDAHAALENLVAFMRENG